MILTLLFGPSEDVWYWTPHVPNVLASSLYFQKLSLLLHHIHSFVKIYDYWSFSISVYKKTRHILILEAWSVDCFQFFFKKRIKPPNLVWLICFLLVDSLIISLIISDDTKSNIIHISPVGEMWIMLLLVNQYLRIWSLCQSGKESA